MSEHNIIGPSGSGGRAGNDYGRWCTRCHKSNPVWGSTCPGQDAQPAPPEPQEAKLPWDKPRELGTHVDSVAPQPASGREVAGYPEGLPEKYRVPWLIASSGGENRPANSGLLLELYTDLAAANRIREALCESLVDLQGETKEASARIAELEAQLVDGVDYKRAAFQLQQQLDAERNNAIVAEARIGVLMEQLDAAKTMMRELEQESHGALQGVVEQAKRATKAESERDAARERVKELEALLDYEPPICRLQLPDGSVPHNVSAAAEAWHKEAQRFWAERDAAIEEAALQKNCFDTIHAKYEAAIARAEAVEKELRFLREYFADDDKCTCGCPVADHERYEEGLSCEHEDHECLPCCASIATMLAELRARAEKAEAAAASWQRLREASVGNAQRVESERDELRAALEKIAESDQLYPMRDIARAALKQEASKDG